MTINIIDESDTYLGGWWQRKGERFIASWLTIYETEKRWFESQMTLLHGRDWNREEEEYYDEILGGDHE